MQHIKDKDLGNRGDFSGVRMCKYHMQFRSFQLMRLPHNTSRILSCIFIEIESKDFSYK